MATKVTKKPLVNTQPVVENNEEDELTMLKRRLAELESKFMDKPVQEVEDVEDVEDVDFNDVKIQQDEYIPVMSLIPYNLNLSTKEGGQGSTKKFTKFGEVKRIIYKDLVDILEVHSKFLESGYFYIMNPALIRQHGLDDVYSKILTKEKLDEILSTNSEESVSLYNSANEKQQEIIIQLLVEKVKSNPDSVNLNIVDRISRASKIDIAKVAEDARASDKELFGEAE